MATPDDAGMIEQFQLAMAEETEQLKLDPDVVHHGVGAVFKNPALGCYYVAEREGKVIGSLLTTYEWSDWRNCNVWWLQSVYVVPEFRRKGVFKKMYSYIRHLAEEQDIAGLRLYVETRNSTAQKTYEALGMSSGHYSFYEWMRK